LQHLELDDLADWIVERLGSSVIPSSFPARIGDMLRETAKHGAYRYIYMLPGGGPYALSVEFVINPDGTLNMEFRDPAGTPFWSGTFRPAEGETHADR
jgi:hypothetical protein